MSDRIVRGALGAALLVGIVVGCSEQVTGSLGCPALCSDQSATLRDTTLDAVVVLDTAFSGFPRLGESRDFTLRSQGDTADVRVIARFDTLPTTYHVNTATADSLIRRVDSAQLIFLFDTLATKPTAPFTIDAFDVDTTATDTIATTLLPLFRANRLIGTRTFAVADVKDTIKIPLSSAVLLRKISDTTSADRLRIGLQIRGATSVKLRILGSIFAPRVRFRPSADTTVPPDTITLRSKTPTTQGDIASALALYPLIAKGPLATKVPFDRLVVGGLNGIRSYLRFDIPSIVLDSVQVIRATLLLDQVAPRAGAIGNDTISLYAQPVIASASVTDVFTASTFLGVGPAYFVDTLRLGARDQGVRALELVNVVRLWRAVGLTNSTRALVLRTPFEGDTPSELTFVSSEGPVAQRPRLRLTYVPRRGFGLP